MYNLFTFPEAKIHILKLPTNESRFNKPEKNL